MSRLAALALLLLGLPTCGQGTGPQLLPPYDGPLEAGREAWTGYQPGSVDIGDLVGPSGIPGMIPGVHAYQVVLAPGIDWNSADALAKATLRNGVPGHLATIGSPEENAAVEALRIALTTGEVWLGGFQPAGSAEPGGGWTWVNGEGTFPGTNGGPAYANWAPGEPNNAQGKEQHLAIGLHGPGLWNDEGILGVAGYVIEWDY